MKHNKDIKRTKKNKILIAVEGDNKTEKLYFSNFNSKDGTYSISFARGNTTDPISMVKRLATECKKLELDLKNGDKAYCIFDNDINTNKENSIFKARAYAEKNRISIITSTPCIELWFLLHFTYTTSSLSNEDVIKRLRNYCSNYNKNLDIYRIIKNDTYTAIENAKKLEKFHISCGNKIGAVKTNPHTEMYIIVEYLLNNKYVESF